VSLGFATLLRKCDRTNTEPILGRREKIEYLFGTTAREHDVTRTERDVEKREHHNPFARRATTMAKSVFEGA
jgi:hypothetical protein